MTGPEDFRLVPCEHCDTEGHIYELMRGFVSWDEPYGEYVGRKCPVCEGSGAELIEGESVTEEEIMEIA
jgi:hypothetical protein